MALKPDYQFNAPSEISYFMNEVGQRGGIVSYSTVGSGAALDQAAALVTYAAVGSGKRPVGVLMGDMVNLDLTRQHLNQHKHEYQKGGKVEIMVDGWVVTDQITSGITLAAGDFAYLTNGARVTNVWVSDLVTPKVGRFLSGTDEDGYAKVRIQL